MRDFKGYTMNDLRGHIKEHLSQVQYKAMEGFKRPLFEDWVKSEAEDGRPCGPTLTSVNDHCKNHSFDYTDLCQRSDVSAF